MRCSEFARQNIDAEPTFTEAQVTERARVVEKRGREMSDEIRRLDDQMDVLSTKIMQLAQIRVAAAREVGELRDMKRDLDDLLLIARACLV